MCLHFDLGRYKYDWVFNYLGQGYENYGFEEGHITNLSLRNLIPRSYLSEVCHKSINC